MEEQAISWFAQGCRHGTPLWQKLQRDMPKTLAETIQIADTYALGDPTQPALDAVGTSRRQPVNNRTGPLRPSDRHEFSYNRRDPDYRYGSDQVATVNMDHPGAGDSQRPKNEGPAWRPNQGAWAKKVWDGPSPPLTFEAMIDGPCRYHKIGRASCRERV